MNAGQVTKIVSLRLLAKQETCLNGPLAQTVKLELIVVGPGRENQF